jgi:hypothetical protein
MYEVPQIETVGSASELIQYFFGPSVDGNGFPNSQGLCSPLEENEE